MDFFTNDFWEKFLFLEMLKGFVHAFVIVASSVYKIPQILLVRSNGSCEGVNINSVLMELFVYATTTMYNYHMQYSIVTYLEYPLIMLQQIVLFMFVFYYARIKEKKYMMKFLILFSAYITVFAKSILDQSYLQYVLPLCFPMSCMSKVLVLCTIFKDKSSKAVSVMTWALSVATNGLRIVTAALETNDSLLFWNFTLSTLLSFTVFNVALYYNFNDTPKKEKRRKRQ